MTLPNEILYSLIRIASVLGGNCGGNVLKRWRYLYRHSNTTNSYGQACDEKLDEEQMGSKDMMEWVKLCTQRLILWPYQQQSASRP